MSRSSGPRTASPGTGAACHAALLLLLLLAACGGGEAGSAAVDTAAPRPLEEPAPSTVAGAPAGDADTSGGESCPMFGAWRRCSVEERLERAGFRPELVREEVRQPSLAIPGAAYRVAAAEVQVFLYADTADARRQAAGVDADAAEPVAADGVRRAPRVVHSGNLVALLFDNNDRLRERLQLALAAGLPRG